MIGCIFILFASIAMNVCNNLHFKFYHGANYNIPKNTFFEYDENNCSI